MPYSQLPGDFAAPTSAPNFAFITPDLCNDGHGCPLATTDTWLAREVPALLASPGFAGSRSLLVITYDEGAGGSDRVATIFAGSGLKPGLRSSAPYAVSIIPSPPAFDTADANCARAIQPIGACTIGYSTPSISVIRFANFM